MKLFPTTLVGSYPQPDWLIDREQLFGQLPARVRAESLWRVGAPWLQQAQDDATILVIREQERAGIDIVTDGEMRRESYSNRFATALEGLDLRHPGVMQGRAARLNVVPRIVGPIRRKHPVQVRDVEFLRANTTRPIKITLPGPFTMSQQAENHFYDSDEALALDYAAAVNEEMKDLFAAGADYVQLDEPYLQAQPEKARRFGVAVLNRALKGVSGATIVHLCFGYAAMVPERPACYSFLAELADCGVSQISVETAQSSLDCSVLAALKGKTIVLGVLDLSTTTIETPAVVAARIRRALPFVSAENLVIAPDCGLKYLSREVALAKLRAMAEGAAIARAEQAG